MTSITHRLIPANGLRFHVAAAGDPQAPLLVFLHGFPEFWRAWQAQLEEFGRDHLAVAPDQRGYNDSDKPQDVGAYRSRHMVEDLRQLAASLTERPFVLVAHDWGGAVAWNFAVAHPERLAKLVIINSPHPVPFARALASDPEQQRASGYMNVFRTPAAEELLAKDGFRRLADMSVAAWQADTAERDAYLEAWSKPGALTGMLNWYRATPMHPPTAQDPGPAQLTVQAADFMVRVPTLVIWGLRDRALLPGLLEGLDECVPDLRIERIPEGSHWVVHEQPARVNALIRGFIG